MCLTLLLIYEPMPSLPFRGITDRLPREERKGLSSIITQGSFRCFVPSGEKNTVAIAEMSPARSPLGSAWFVFQAFIFSNFKDKKKKSSYLTYSNEQRCFNKLSNASRCFFVKSDNKPFGFNGIGIGVFNRKHILC